MMAASIPNITCRPKTEMPDFVNLPIPQNINVFGTPGHDTSYYPMAACCAPSLVQIVDRCYLWCEIPKRYFNGTDKNGARDAITSCMVLQMYKNETEGRIMGVQMNGVGRVGVGSVTRVGILVLALSGLVYVL